MIGGMIEFFIMTAFFFFIILFFALSGNVWKDKP